jgi:hypothetical protein
MKKNNAVIMVCLILVCCLAACKGKIQKDKVETIEGVTYIHNPATPLHPSRTVIFEEEFIYEGTDQAGEICLFKPGGFAVDTKGNVYIEDASDMAIKVFDQAGKFLRALGRRGEGPGEFSSVGYIIPLPDGRLLVTDPLARRTSFFEPEGQFLSSFAWRQNFQRIYLATDSSHTLEESVIFEETRGLWIRTIDFLGNELITFGKFSLPELKEFHMGEGMTMIPVPWGPASVFAGDQTRQWLYHCPSDKYEIEVYDRQANLIRKIDRRYERVPVRSEDISEYRSRFADSPIVQLFLQMEFPKVKSITNRMIVDSEGNLWVRTSEVKREEGKEIAAYDIFNPDGFYEARVWIDIIPAAFAGGRMYLMDEDETTGMRRVIRFRVIWKESLENR